MANRYYRGPVSDHFDGERFFNPGLPLSDKTFMDMFLWRLGAKHSTWPLTVFGERYTKPDAHVPGLRITLIGHSSLLIQVAGKNILVDPVWSKRVSPLSFAGPERHNPPAIHFADLPSIDAVLITHSHYDHLDIASLRRVWSTYRPLVLAPLGNDGVIQAAAPEIEVRTADWWGSFDCLPGLKITVVPAYHWSLRRYGDLRMALWGGFFLEGQGASVYCAGDTAYRGGAIFREIQQRLGSATVAVLPIGAYEPRWFMQTQHANPAEALRIAEDCGAQQVLGVHWGTFQLTDEPFDEPEQKLALAAARGRGPARVHAMRPGDVWEGS